MRHVGDAIRREDGAHPRLQLTQRLVVGDLLQFREFFVGEEQQQCRLVEGRELPFQRGEGNSCDRVRCRKNGKDNSLRIAEEEPVHGA